MTEFEFFLCDLSFEEPQNLTIEVLRNRIEQLSSDCDFIRSNDEVIFRANSVYEVMFFGEWGIMDMYSPEFQELIGRDHSFMLQTIIDHSTTTDHDSQTIIGLLANHSEEIGNGLICLHGVQDIDPLYCVYQRNDWYQFHRYFLGLYPINEDNFIQGCSTYFPKLDFQSEIASSLRSLEGGGLNNFARVICHCLSKLIDDFPACFIPSNVVNSLIRFSTICGYETTNEGNINRRADLSFSFENNSGDSISVYCEPHIKLSRSDRTGDSHHYQNRIYFHVGGRQDIAEGKVLVAHIGGHL